VYDLFLEEMERKRIPEIVLNKKGMKHKDVVISAHKMKSILYDASVTKCNTKCNRKGTHFILGNP